MTAGAYSIGSAHWPGVSKLIEEIGELGQVLGKIIAVGGQTAVAHYDGTDLNARLVEELGDVSAAIDFLVYVNDLDSAAVTGRGTVKFALFRKWHEAQGGAA